MHDVLQDGFCEVPSVVLVGFLSMCVGLALNVLVFAWFSCATIFFLINEIGKAFSAVSDFFCIWCST